MAESLEDARAVADMARMPGWRHVKEAMAQSVRGYEQRLRSCSAEELPRLQGMIAGMECVMNYVSARVRQTERVQNQ